MPRYGFNFLWIFARREEGQRPLEPAGAELDFLAGEGLDFVRVPSDYRFWTRADDYFHPDERTLEFFDRYLAACRQRKLQMCLNLHRAPGYCVNRNELETHNLWLDRQAQDAFVFLWETFARRYRGVPAEALSFDLLNEPPAEGRYGLSRENHAALMRRAAAAIRAVDPSREIVVDGLACGNDALPELSDLGVIHSGRGYQPMAVTHYQAQWWKGHEGLPEPTYPNLRFSGRVWNLGGLRDWYRPWLEVEARGVKVHIGEFGCYNRTPNPVALAWFRDLLAVFREFRWGYALWNFKGAFGIVEHGRPGAVFEQYRGFRVDRELLDLFLSHRVKAG
jgi:hypothetical protein